MIHGLITPYDIETLNAARTVLERIDQSCKHEHHRSADDQHEAFALGKVSEAADVAGDAIFNVLNVVSSWAHVELTGAQLRNSGDDEEAPA